MNPEPTDYEALDVELAFWAIVDPISRAFRCQAQPDAEIANIMGLGR